MCARFVAVPTAIVKLIETLGFPHFDFISICYRPTSIDIRVLELDIHASRIIAIAIYIIDIYVL